MDDRFLRGLRREPSRPCADTSDLIHHLYRISRLTEGQLDDVFSKLRAANFRYLPVRESEILGHLRQAPVENDALVETAALRRLRRYMAAALLDAEWLQRPGETAPGQRLLLESGMATRWYLTLVHVITEIWGDEKSTLQQRIARANWVWNHLYFDIRLVQELFGPPAGQMPPSQAAGQSLGHLFGQGIVIRGGTRESPRATYFEWLFNHCVAPIIPNNPEMISMIAGFLRWLVDEGLRELDKAERTAGPTSKEFCGRLILMGQFLFDLPPAILDALRLSPAELNRFGLARANAPFEVLGIGLEPSEFWPAVARALDRGYAAILKPGTRLQMRRDAPERVRIMRKGQGARGGGCLNVPCLMLLASQRTERMAARRSCSSWFDLKAPQRQVLFERLADIAEPTERMRQLHEHLEKSAAWFYWQFEGRAKDRQARSRPFKVSDLMPRFLASLRGHLGLDVESGSQPEKSWPEAVVTLLDQEGLEETLVRLSCLPVRLPECVLERVKALSKAELASLLSRLDARLQSPLQRLQFLFLALSFGGDLSHLIAQARNDLGRLLDSGDGTHAAEALVALARWSHLRFGWSSEASCWSAETRLRMAWVHAGRLHSAFTAGGFPLEELAEWVSENSQGIAAASISPASELGWDAASPSGVTGESLLMLSLADFAAQLPTEVVAELELPALFRKWAPTAGEMSPALFSVWHDTALRSNALCSYLGAVDQSGLRCLVGDVWFQSLAQTPPAVGYQRALAELQETSVG